MKVPNLAEFKIIDLYSDESLKDNFSLSLNFIFRNLERTLEDSEVSDAMNVIVLALKDKLGLNLR